MSDIVLEIKTLTRRFGTFTAVDALTIGRYQTKSQAGHDRSILDEGPQGMGQYGRQQFSVAQESRQRRIAPAALKPGKITSTFLRTGLFPCPSKRPERSISPA
jgi:hypothetical protein